MQAEYNIYIYIYTYIHTHTGGVDRLGQVVIRAMHTDGRYVPCVQTYQGFEKQLLWRIDGTESDKPYPEGTQVCMCVCMICMFLPRL